MYVISSAICCLLDWVGLCVSWLVACAALLGVVLVGWLVVCL